MVWIHKYKGIHVYECLPRCISKHTHLRTRVLSDPVCPLLAACWLYSARLVIKPFHGRNFHTAVNCVRWLKAAQFVVQSLCYSSSLIFYRPLKWEPLTAGFSHRNIRMHTLLFLPLSCRKVFHWHVSNLITPQITCHVFHYVYVINFVVFLLICN